ncbi:MAG: hypothetical protein ACP5E4_03635 [Candidatus Aenigmatarchaeota archaeon]
MNRTIVIRILIESLKYLTLGVGLIIVGLTIGKFLYGGTVIILQIALPFIGSMMVIMAILELASYNSSNAYVCWEHYNKDDKNVAEAIELIKQRGVEKTSGELIISEKWIIQPSSLSFVRPKDINWAFINRQGKKESGRYTQTIEVRTNFGLTITVPCSTIHAKKDEEVDFYFSQLKKHNKKIVLGYSEEREKLWRKSHLNFSENIANL